MPGIEHFFAEMTPGAYGVYGLLILAMSYLVKGWHETRKLTTEERQARREGFTAQVANLAAELSATRGENRALLMDLHNLRNEYDAHRRQCHQELEQLRRMFVESEAEVEGLKRKVATQAYEIAKLQGFDK